VTHRTPSARLTARQLNRATLARQLLLDREPLSVADAMRHVVALQAQEAASPYVALWNRLAGFDPSMLDQAFREQVVIKASLLRITLHAVHVDDYPAFHGAMQRTLRASCLDDPRFTRAALTPEDADALIPGLRTFGARPRTNADIEAWLDERLGVKPKNSIWWALRRFAPMVHAPTGAAWMFGPRPAYIAAPELPRPDPDSAMEHLAWRFLEGFGPASMQDLAQFSTIYRPPARSALEALAERLVRFEGPNGAELFDVPDAPLPPEDAPAPPRLMAMWDSVLLAYQDRSRLIPPEHRQLVMRSNGDVLPTLLVDGYVAGIWRVVDGAIEASAFHRLPDDAWEGLGAEAVSLLRLLTERDPKVYNRYHHWWSKLPKAAETRVLPG
jgi:Winged helix DNA-binding domain